jgi:hypothetical protein
LRQDFDFTQPPRPPLLLPVRDVADEFTRQTSNGWGYAEVGGHYLLTGPAASFATTGTVATLLVSADSAPAAMLPEVSLTDVDGELSLALDTLPGGPVTLDFVARANPAGEYRSRLQITAQGQVSVQAYRVTPGGNRALAAPLLVAGVTYAPGTWLKLRTQVEGAVIRIKSWVSTAAEPDWQLTVTDLAPLAQAGSVGLRAALAAPSASPLRIAIEGLRVRSVAARLAADQIAQVTFSIYEGDSPIYVWGEDGWTEQTDQIEEYEELMPEEEVAPARELYLPLVRP